jgi:hypothetical protein
MMGFKSESHASADHHDPFDDLINGRRDDRIDDGVGMIYQAT